MKGIEPSYAAWEAAVLPLNYTRGRIVDCRFQIADLQSKARHCHEITSSDILKSASFVLFLPSDQAITPLRSGLLPALE